MLTMLIGGLWHGAAWTFVAWGAYHGLLLALYRRIAPAWDALSAWVRRPAMWLAVAVGWVLFRSTSFGMATVLLRKMFVPTPGNLVPDARLAAAAVAIAAVWATAGPSAFEMKHERSFRRDLVLATALAACVAIVLGSRSSPFLYYQF
jgi:alginate O-acetyltransferase complex protein AlgI